MKPVLVGVDRSRPRRVISDTPAQRDLKETRQERGGGEEEEDGEGGGGGGEGGEAEGGGGEAKAEVDRVRRSGAQFIQHAMCMKIVKLEQAITKKISSQFSR